MWVKNQGKTCLSVGLVSMAPYLIHYWVVVFQSQNSGYVGHYNLSLLSLKFTTFCTHLRSPPDGVRGVSPPPRSIPIHWSRLRPGTPPPPCLSRSHPLCWRLPRTPSPSTPLLLDPPLLLLLPPSTWLLQTDVKIGRASV